MPDLKTYGLFISHAWTYNDEYYRLLEFLTNAPNFKFRNYSVPEHDPLDANNETKLRKMLDSQIRPVNVVIVLAGMYATHRNWIQYEIDQAVGYSKPILAVHPWGQERTPVNVSNVADEEVNWNTASIVGAIRRISL